MYILFTINKWNKYKTQMKHYERVGIDNHTGTIADMNNWGVSKNFAKCSLWLPYRRLNDFDSLGIFLAPWLIILLMRVSAEEINPSFPVEQIAIRSNSEEIVEKKIVEGILLDK